MIELNEVWSKVSDIIIIDHEPSEHKRQLTRNPSVFIKINQQKNIT